MFAIPSPVTMLRVLFLVATLVAGTPTLITATPRPAEAATNVRPDVGVHFHGTWSSYTDAQRLKVLDRLAEAGVEWIRLDLGWASYEEKCSGCRSQWYVDRADRVIDAARARGIKVLAQVGMVPGWANGGQATGVPPHDPAEFGRFMGWLSGHLRGRVDAYELWNEPNLPRFWNGTPSQFAEMMKAAYPRVKASDPTAPVVLGGVSYNDSTWLRAAYDAGVGPYFDVLATHPYMAPSDLGPEVPDTKGTNIYLLSHVAAVHRLMTDRGDGHKKIWFTEFGWSSHPNSGTEANWSRGVSEQQQADYLVRTINYVTANYPYVTNVFWYTERDRGTTAEHINNYGLLYHDLSPKPAYAALKQRLAVAAPSVPAAPVLAQHSDTGTSDSDGVTSATVIDVRGVAPADTTVRVSVDGTERAAVDPVDGRYAATVDLGHDGPHTVTVTVTDRSGRTSTASGPLRVLVDTRPPAAGAPVARLRAGGSLSASGEVQVDIAWPATGSDDVVLYELEQSRDLGVTWQSISTTPSVNAVAAVPTTIMDGVRHRLQATDRAGNVGAHIERATSTAVVEESASAVWVSAVPWREEVSSDASGGRLLHADKAGAGAVFTFTGSSVAWVGASAPNRGKADVLLDGVRVATVDSYSATPRHRALQFATPVAPGVVHRLEIRPLGKGSASSRRVDVDAFVVLR